MNFLGLVGNYRVNRRLTEQEKEQQLRQTKRLDITPHYQLSVIKMNSTYLESVDKWYGWKGTISAVAMTVFSIFAVGYGALLYAGLAADGGARGRDDSIFILGASGLLVSPIIMIAIWLFFRENFSYTHYPIRFNRRNREVHVFRRNGSVLTVPWEDLFFTLGHMPTWNQWEIRAHVLDNARETVLETFPLSYVGSLNASDVQPANGQSSAEDFLRAHWEFIRRYMEEGPQSVISQVEFCMPVDRKRESLRLSFDRIFGNIAGAPLIFMPILVPLCLFAFIGRVIAMHTSSVPVWPEDVANSSPIAVGDPYAIEGDENGNRVSLR